MFLNDPLNLEGFSHSSVAQSAVHLTVNQRVAGSSPAGGVG